MGITEVRDVVPVGQRAAVQAQFFLPQIGDQVLITDGAAASGGSAKAQTTPRSDGIIAVLIGAVGTDAGRQSQDDHRLAAPAPLTAPLGSTKGSFIDVTFPPRATYMPPAAPSFPAVAGEPWCNPRL